MGDLEMWSLIVSFFLPLVVAVAQQPRLSQAERVVVMVVFCAVAAVVTAWLKGELNSHNWFHSFLVMGVGTIVFYRGVWKPTGVAPRIEIATSTSKP